jgi:hypothetical protein
MAVNIVSYNVVGDCNNTSAGTISFLFTTNSYPVTLNWTDYPIGYSAQTGIVFNSLSNSYSFTGLTSGIYGFNLQNNLVGGIGSTSVAFYVTSSNTSTATVTRNAICSNNNGIIVNNITLPSTQSISPIINGFSSLTNLYSSNVVYSSSSANTVVSFLGLPSGLYYTQSTDMCGCVSTSNSVIVTQSNEIDFGLYTIDTTSCSGNAGRIIVTGLTGTPPYTYQWNPPVGNQTGSTLTGLSIGTYSVTINDANLCSKTLSSNVGYVPTLSYVTFNSTSPSCYTNDGDITFYFSGGAAPFYYQLSNGDSQYSLSNQVTFTGLAAGYYTCVVNDVGLCTAKGSVNLVTPSSFSVLSLNSKPASCGYLGSISLQYNGGSPPYQISLSGTNYPTVTQTSQLTTATFQNLVPDTYTITLQDNSNICTYTSNIVVGNINHFTLSASTTGTTCGGSNGAIEIMVLNPHTTGLTYTYSFGSVLSVPTTATTYTYQNLGAGLYNIKVIDSENCIQTINATIDNSVGPKIFLDKTNCVEGQNNGTITAYIKSTDGSFDINWSNNVTGQTGIYLSGLSAGTYVMSITGESGCQAIKATVITCNPATSTATTYSVKYATGTITTVGGTQLTLQNMMYNGFSSLISQNNAENCVLSSATFYADVTIGGTPYSFPFYSTYSLDNIPPISYFKNVIENAVISIPNIASCIVNTDNLTIDIVAGTSGNSEFYANETISFVISISYIINCNSINNVIC